MVATKTIVGGTVVGMIAAASLSLAAVNIRWTGHGCGSHGAAGVAAIQVACPGSVPSNPPTCGLSSPAFCDTFDTAAGTGNRSGQLKGNVWGVSRQKGAGNNAGQGQFGAWVAPSTMYGTCSPTTGQSVSPDGTDISICNGQLNETVNDNPNINSGNPTLIDGGGDVTSLAMYPKQPFDWAGRTGKVVFDVSNDTGGDHTAWPEFWISNLPVPDPFVHFETWQGFSQYAIGIRIDAVCEPNQGPNCAPNCPFSNTRVVAVESAVLVNNYQLYDSDGADTNPNNHGLTIAKDNCVTEPVNPGFNATTISNMLNHFEVDVSSSQIDVYGTEPFTGALNLVATPLKHLATIAAPGGNLGFTRGLIWAEDAHYNGNKNIQPELQAMHTFVWDNIGFDGPVLNRDLTFDVPDALTLATDTRQKNLGFFNQGTPNSVTVSTLPVNNIAGAAAGVLTLNLFCSQPDNVTYSLNGNTPHTFNWPFPDTGGNCPRTLGIPISLSELVTGANSITIQDSDPTGIFVSNIDIILAGAGGPGGPVQ